MTSFNGEDNFKVNETAARGVSGFQRRRIYVVLNIVFSRSLVFRLYNIDAHYFLTLTIIPANELFPMIQQSLHGREKLTH